jgi:hypothetical protein
MFLGILQVFHIDVAKVDRDVPYVAMVVHVCCKRLLKVLHTYVESVFIWMLHMFYTYVGNVFIWMLQWFHMFFASVFKAFHYVFRHMLQVLYSDVSKVNQVLHLASRLLLP